MPWPPTLALFTASRVGSVAGQGTDLATGTSPSRAHADADTGPPTAAVADGADEAPPSPQPRWTDNHCHLPADPGDAEASVAEARAAGVERLVNVGTDVTASAAAVRAAESLDGVWATAGVHPHEAKQGLDGLEAVLESAARGGRR